MFCLVYQLLQATAVLSLLPGAGLSPSGQSPTWLQATSPRASMPRGFGQLSSLCFHRKGEATGPTWDMLHPGFSLLLSHALTSESALPHAGPCRQRMRLGAVILSRDDGLDYGRPTKRENARESSSLCEYLQLCQLRPLIYIYQSIFPLWCSQSTLPEANHFQEECACTGTSIGCSGCHRKGQGH